MQLQPLPTREKNHRSDEQSLGRGYANVLAALTYICIHVCYPCRADKVLIESLCREAGFTVVPETTEQEFEETLLEAEVHAMLEEEKAAAQVTNQLTA